MINKKWTFRFICSSLKNILKDGLDQIFKKLDIQILDVDKEPSNFTKIQSELYKVLNLVECLENEKNYWIKGLMKNY